MTTSDQLAAVVATELERMQRLQHLGDFGTAGPTPAPPSVAPIIEHPKWTAGRWIGAKWMAAHPGRVGGPITPFATVVHTTDMLPGEWSSLIGRWQTVAADGACAHFVIGRSAAEGVVQLVPCNRNGNHAGGPQAGRFADSAGRLYHPNLVTVGIEVHCAGQVRRVAGQWRLVESGKAHGEALPDADVIKDPNHTDRGWHKVTDYQYEQLAALLDDLEHVLAPLPAGTVTESLYEQPAPWSTLPSARVTGHHNLDARNRDDPHKPTYEWLRSRAR